MFSVIWGAADMGTQLTETELQKALDFCVNLFSPTTPDQHKRVAQDENIKPELLDVRQPVIDPKIFQSALTVQRSTVLNTETKLDEQSTVIPNDSSDRVDTNITAPLASNASANRTKSTYGRMRSSSEDKRVVETNMVLNKINARRVVHAEYAINNLESEPLDGFVVRLKRGNLGLSSVN